MSSRTKTTRSDAKKENDKKESYKRLSVRNVSGLPGISRTSPYHTGALSMALADEVK